MDVRNQRFIELLVRHLMAFRKDWWLYVDNEIHDETQKEFHTYAMRALGAMISAFRRWLTRMEEQKVKDVEN